MSPPRRRIAVFCDSPDEHWPSMDLVAEMLVSEWQTTFADKVDSRAISVPIRNFARRVPSIGVTNAAFNLDRLVTRFVTYPCRALAVRAESQGVNVQYHVADHTYAQLVHALPSERTGVYCHDVDAFRSLFDPIRDPRPRWFRALAKTILRGLQKAAVVFHSTKVVRAEIERYGLLPAGKLVHAPYGVSPEFNSDEEALGARGASAVLAPLGGSPFVFHVGSALPRKRLDVLFDAFARTRVEFPALRLVQQGATLSHQQRQHARAAGIEGALLQPPKLPRTTLAALYRRAAIVLVPSDAEGFGFPVIEALASGAIVVASDIPVLREIGGDAVIYCPVGDASAWAETVGGILRGATRPPPRAVRTAQAARFTWREHARLVLSAYEEVAERW